MKILVKVPATTANLGPGFDALGLALDLWNESTFELADDFSVYIEGEGQGRLTQGKHNLIVRSALKLAEHVGKELPRFIVRCVNHIPSGSGLGSSAAATLTGLLAANALTRSALSEGEILNLATEIEGHSDNVAPALMGGLVVSTLGNGNVIARKIVDSRPSIHTTVVVPNFRFPTKQARNALPRQVKMKDAVHNISRAILVADAFRTGDLNLLREAMTDRLHQPYRIPLIPGAQAAMDAMKRAGASAVTLSGAGPSLIAFSSKREKPIGEAGKRAFARSGLDSRIFELKISNKGTEVHKSP
ncbi:MAG TPA: homoserine kinase [Anaerolineales bacterium]|nr:homoserine kinase [Anaerolineales bacterium]